jgi:predicted metal-dependent peptidase
MLAISRLAADMPLHAGILGRWKLLEDSTINTMAVGFQRGRLILYYAPAFVERTSLSDLVGIVEHECLHVLLQHVFHDPSPGENSNARTVAEEVTCNEWVSHPLPGKPILLADYPMLRANEDTDSRYDCLKNIIPALKVITIDDHAKWAEILASGQLAGAVIRTVIAAAWDKLTPEQKAKMSLAAQVQQAIQQAVQSSVIGVGTANVPWQKVLRAYVGRSLRRRPVFGRVPRRFPDLVGVLPARGRSGSQPKVMAVMDTSGSMTPALLADISAELAVMSRTHEVIVVEADDEIRAVYQFKPITEVGGRGGTDFRPVFQETFLREHKPDLVVYFTDGHGQAPADPPLIPVIWCLTPHGRQPCSWGKTLRLVG